MDHAIEKVRIYFDISLDELYDEWKTGDYKKLSECPSYEEASTYRKAMNVMRNYYYHDYQPHTLKEEMESYIWMTRNITI